MPAPNTPALILRRLSKSFGRLAVDQLDLTIGAGEFYALLGPNGVGKTTTLRLVAGLLQPTTGTSRSSGSTRAARRSTPSAIVAWLPDEPMLYDKLDPLEYLEFVAGLWSVDGSRRETVGGRVAGKPGLMAASARTLRRVFARHAAEAGSRRRAHP